jgi:hypothetical protein
MYKGLRVVASGLYYENPKHQYPIYWSSVVLTETKYSPGKHSDYLDILSLKPSERGVYNRLEFRFTRYKPVLERKFMSLLLNVKRRCLLRSRLRRLAQKAKLKRLIPDLIAAVWHPRRVEKWLEQGVALETL